MTVTKDNETTAPAEKQPSRLAVLLKGFKTRASEKDLAFAKAKLEEAMAKVEKARRALEAAETAEQAAVETMVKHAGRARIRLSNGEIRFPSCRGDRVFYRTVGSETDIV